MAALSADLENTFENIVQAWSADGGNYLANFTSPGSAGTDIETAHAAVDAMVNQMIAVVFFKSTPDSI